MYRQNTRRPQSWLDRSKSKKWKDWSGTGLVHHRGTWRRTFPMHIRLPPVRTEQLSAADASVLLVNAHHADAEANFQMICTNYTKGFQTEMHDCSLLWINSLSEIDLIETEDFLQNNTMTHSRRLDHPPTALLGSPHSAWCISQVQRKI